VKKKREEGNPYNMTPGNPLHTAIVNLNPRVGKYSQGNYSQYGTVTFKKFIGYNK
jgi:hypothetical protein